VCGIAGIATSEAGKLPPPEVADAMCRVISHRGPDDQGMYFESRAFLGMRRLSIIDLAGGHQPIHNEDKSVWVVFNGEIYNFRDLRRRLEARGHVFYTNSDTECIVHCYEEYGESFARYLRGMFGIAIWDARAQKLVLVRDRLGKKPLYYKVDSDRLIFGSELKSLLQCPDLCRRVSEEAIASYLTFGYVPGPASIFEGVNKLPPAHYLVYENGRVRVERYWQLDFEPKWQGDEAELGEQLYERLEEAVRVRLVSDVPFGVFLSGGLDSSIVAALMAKHLSLPVKTFTIGFREAAYDETQDARAVASHIGAEHTELIVEANAVDLAQELSWFLDEPFGDASAIPTYLVSKLASQHVKMVLGGDGGDESFAGYERYRRYQILDGAARLPFGIAGRALRWVSRIAAAGVGYRLARVGNRLAMPFPDRYISGVAVGTTETVTQLISNGGKVTDIYQPVREMYLRNDIQTPLERILAGDIKSYLVDDVMVKVDRMTMANSIEARAPLLDHELVEFAARLPLAMKYRGGVGKYLLRRVGQRLLPASTLAKRKQGFGIPLASWFRAELRELVSDLVGSQRFRERGVFDANSAQHYLRKHLAGTHDYSEPLWLLLMFELWARRFLDDRARPPTESSRLDAHQRVGAS